MSALGLLVALLALAGTAFLLWRPQYAIVLVLVMFPLEQLLQAYFPILLTRPILVNAAIAILTAFAVASRFSRGERLLDGYLNPTTVCVLMLYGLAWISLAWSPEPTGVRGMMIHGLPYALCMLVMLPMLVGDLESFRRVVLGLLLVGAAICLMIMLSPAASFSGARFTIQFPASIGDMRGNPLVVASLGGTIAMVAILYRPQTRSPITLGIRIAAAVIGLGLAILSGSRGQVIFAVASAFLFFPFARQVRNVRQFLTVGFGLGAVALLALLAFDLFVTEENINRWGSASFEAGVDNRMGHITLLLQAFADRPQNWLLGMGAGAFFHHSGGGSYVHNSLIEALCEQGVVGLALLLLALWFGFQAGRRLILLYRDQPEARSAVAALGAMCCFSFLLSLKEGSISSAATTYMSLFLLSKISANEWRAATIAAEEEQASAEAAMEEADLHHDDPALEAAYGER